MTVFIVYSIILFFRKKASNASLNLSGSSIIRKWLTPSQI
jgi:hypothetical protein